ncbi:hypothetical protein [Halovulum dunhuangense]|nr:hypothetical protein [Halovulum dunhuangense]
MKYLFLLLVLGAIALSVYALLFDLPAPQEPLVVPVTPAQG